MLGLCALLNFYAVVNHLFLWSYFLVGGFLRVIFIDYCFCFETSSVSKKLSLERHLYTRDFIATAFELKLVYREQSNRGLGDSARWVH